VWSISYPLCRQVLGLFLDFWRASCGWPPRIGGIGPGRPAADAEKGAPFWGLRPVLCPPVVSNEKHSNYAI